MAKFVNSSLDGSSTPVAGPDMMSVLLKRLTLRGFIVLDFAGRKADFLLTSSARSKIDCGTVRPSAATKPLATGSATPAMTIGIVRPLERYPAVFLEGDWRVGSARRLEDR
jgi:hypothetical protein